MPAILSRGHMGSRRRRNASCESKSHTPESSPISSHDSRRSIFITSDAQDATMPARNPKYMQSVSQAKSRLPSFLLRSQAQIGNLYSKYDDTFHALTVAGSSCSSTNSTEQKAHYLARNCPAPDYLLFGFTEGKLQSIPSSGSWGQFVDFSNEEELKRQTNLTARKTEHKKQVFGWRTFFQ